MSRTKTTLFFWPTPNCYEVSILVEELELEYEVHPVHIGKGEQFDHEFAEISPHSKVPALKEDTANGKTQTIFESGAIMLYLAEKHKQLLGGKKTSKLSVIQWLMFQMANIGPMLGQAHHFRHYAHENIQYAINRYTNEASKIYAVLDAQLGKSQYIAGGGLQYR